MGKFFLPQSRQHSQKHKNDYRLIAYQQFLQLIKAKHLQYISKTIKEIHDIKTQEGNINEQKKTEKMRKLQQKLEQLKQIKKKQMKLAVLYIISKILNISNIAILQKFSGLSSSIQQIATEVEQRAEIKQFLQKIKGQKGYRQRIDKICDLIDGISKKKQITKQRSKERKVKKLQRRSGRVMKQTKQQKQMIQQQQQVQDEVSSSNNQENKNKQIKQKPEILQTQIIEKPEIKDEKEARREFWKRSNERKIQKQIEQKQPEHHKKGNYLQNQEKSTRTQFVKRGRNKVKQERKQKRQGFTKKIQKQTQTSKVEPEQEKKSKKQTKEKINPHPSWLAKQEQAKRSGIVQFQGKKIIL